MDILSAILNGVFLSLVVAINGVLMQGAGNFSALLIINVSGFALVCIYYFGIRRYRLPSLKGIPGYFFFSGFLSMFSTLFSSLSAIHIGLTLSVCLALFTRIVTAALIDHYGFFEREKRPFKPLRLISFAIMFGGAAVMMLAN